MAGLGIKNQQLKARLNNVGQKDWIKLAECHELLVVKGGKGSHYINIRDPKKPDSNDVTGLISTITPNLFKQANEQIFKKFLRYGLSEEQVWRGLGLMK